MGAPSCDRLSIVVHARGGTNSTTWFYKLRQTEIHEDGHDTKDNLYAAATGVSDSSRARHCSNHSHEDDDVYL